MCFCFPICRTCTNPAPANGGKQCTGSASGSAGCYKGKPDCAAAGR